MPCMHLWEPFCLAILNDTPMCDSSGHELAVELPPLRIGFKFLISTMFFFFFLLCTPPAAASSTHPSILPYAPTSNPFKSHNQFNLLLTGTQRQQFSD